jgi:hypothetical protein
MKSHEVLTEAVQSIGVKSIAYDMGLSASLLYKWLQSEHNSGTAINPLDRVMELHQLTGNDNLIQWICNNAGGFFVKNIQVKGEHGKQLFECTQSILKEFSEMLTAITESNEDGKVTNQEAETIRKEWEDLKSVTESFIVSCENGSYKGKE